MRAFWNYSKSVVRNWYSLNDDSKLETCVICLEDKPTTLFFHTDTCSHRYCFSCMKQHVEAKLLIGILPKCPHEECNSELKIEICKVFLPPKSIEILSQRIREASIPVSERVYCPFLKCSALMSRKEILKNLRVTQVDSTQNGAMSCLKCENIFCINCKIPWHKNLSCRDYKILNPYTSVNEQKLKKLADLKHWRRCKSCDSLIELASGCYHITCRCGYEFCYSCGAGWKNKKATCSCLLWDDEYIDDEYIVEDEEFRDIRNNGDGIARINFWEFLKDYCEMIIMGYFHKFF